AASRTIETVARGAEGEMESTRPKPRPRLCLLGMLSVGLLFTASAAQATAAGRPVAWGCGGQCRLPSGLSGVTALAASSVHSLALKSDGTVVAWGCGDAFPDYQQCSVPSGLSGVTAIAAGRAQSLALKSGGTVVAWGCRSAFPDPGTCSLPSGLSGVTAIA